jgi:radical SAM protein with 4Fe4S-binding SPASM domain
MHINYGEESISYERAIHLSMTDKQYDLNDNPSFCMLGLLHTYISPDGTVMPCCVSDTTKPPLGNINEISSWNEIWNGEKYKEFRRMMIAGEKNPLCSFCYDTEKFSDISLRKWRNTQFAEDYDYYMSQLLQTGEMKTSKLKYIDFRFSNHCNQACITCGHSLSSSWYDLLQKLNMPTNAPKFIEPTDDKIAYQLIDDNLDSITNIYFAGGEPMLSKYHWYTLDKLIELDRAKEIDLEYSTNCSTLKYKDKDVLEYWKMFKSVTIMASIDDVGERFNYIRWPAKWDSVSQNLKRIHECFEEKNNGKDPTHKLCFAPVLSALNLHRLQEIVEEFISIGIYQESNKYHPKFEYFLFSNIIRSPIHLNVKSIPEQHWQYVVRKLDDFENWYLGSVIPETTNPYKKIFITKQIKAIKEMRKIDQKDMDFLQSDGPEYLECLEVYSKLDAARNTDFIETFPELGWLYK